jgi:hypothetical protein
MEIITNQLHVSITFHSLIFWKQITFRDKKVAITSILQIKVPEF